MKRTVVTGLMLLAIGAAAFWWLRGEELQSAVIPIAGMHCENCADHIETELQRCDGVEAAEVNFGEAVAKVAYDASVITVPALEKKIAALGYQTGNAGGMQSAPSSGAPACAADQAETPGCCAGKPAKSST